MEAVDAIRASAAISELIRPYVIDVETRPGMTGADKHAAVKGIARVLIFSAQTLSPSVAALFTGVSVQQVDAMVDVAIAALVQFYHLIGLFIKKAKDALS